MFIFKKIDTLNEFIDMLIDSEESFLEMMSVEAFEEFFGFSRNWNEDTGDILETISEYYSRGGDFCKVPSKEEFPICLYLEITKDVDRFGKVSVMRYDWISL